jgi:hypothetical protein
MRILFVLLLTVSAGAGRAQLRLEDIHTDFVLYNKRVALEKDLRERMVARHFALPLDRDSEDGYLSGCWAIGQFLFDSPEVRAGFGRLFAGYDSLTRDTRLAFLEAVYAVEPDRYRRDMAGVLAREQDPRLFSLAAAYLYRTDTSMAHVDSLKIGMVERFPGYDTVAVLRELLHYLGDDGAQRRAATPPLAELLGMGRLLDAKIVYSFQRWDRDYPGLAIVQQADGSFARDGEGRLEVFPQLARSGPGTPYFLTNGNTPQGIFSIQGTDVSHTNFIGPTPNLQLLMPGEGKWADYFHETAIDSSKAEISRVADTAGIPALLLAGYLELLPESWRGYVPMQEAFAAGAVGRTEIIAHGTTIDPEYYKGWPFYPLTPTMGCLCAKELWNPTSGHPLVSEQNNLMNAFLEIGRTEAGRAPKSGGRRWSGGEGRQRSDEGRTGWLVVVNVDDRREPVSRAEVETWVRAYEKKNPRL